MRNNRISMHRDTLSRLHRETGRGALAAGRFYPRRDVSSRLSFARTRRRVFEGIYRCNAVVSALATPIYRVRFGAIRVARASYGAVNRRRSFLPRIRILNHRGDDRRDFLLYSTVIRVLSFDGH